jgi:hypothetical protein
MIENLEAQALGLIDHWRRDTCAERLSRLALDAEHMMMVVIGP